LLKDLNEKYNIIQEENRLSDAKSLKEKRKKLKKILDKKISENVNCFHKGEKCNISIATKSKDNKNDPLNKVSTIKKNNIMIETIGSDVISFDSFSDSYSKPDLDYLMTISSENTGNNNDNIEVIPTLTTTHYERSDLDVKIEIEKLDSEIMYLEKKNKRPIDYILDRFSIQDDILVLIIKIFDRTLDDVIYTMKNYYEDTIYFQFKIADKFSSIKKNMNY